MAAGAAGQSGCARPGTAGAALARGAASGVACRVGSGRREGRLFAHLTGAGLPADGDLPAGSLCRRGRHCHRIVTRGSWTRVPA